MNCKAIHFIAFLLLLKVIQSVDQLLFVQSVWRHGDRTPVWDYPNNPLKDYKWPVGPGELTPLGSEQQTDLGSDLRRRYIDGERFLSPRYNLNEIYIRSTNVSRTIASARANMLGLFPEDYIETDSIDGPFRSTVVPVHIYDIENDFAAYIPPCPNFDREQESYLTSLKPEKVYDDHRGTFELISKETGLNITFSNFDCYMIYDLLFIQRIYGLKIPDWATPQIMYDLKQLSIWQVDSFLGWNDPPSTQITRYRGELLKEMIERMNDKLRCHSSGNQGEDCKSLGPLKFYAYSAHDITVGSLLASLGSYLALPGRILHYTVSTTLELWLRNGKPYVKVILRPTSWSSFHTFTQFTTGCPRGEEYCPLDIFIQRSAPYLPNDIKKDCGII